MATKATGSILNITVNIQGIVYSSGNIMNFTYYNRINEVPSGDFIILDTNSDMLVIKTGDIGIMYFTNTSDDNTEKASSLNFIIEKIDKLQNVTAPNSAYKISWSAGNKESQVRKTRAIKGNSIDAFKENAKVYGYEIKEEMSDLKYDKPSDTMTWRYISDTMWDTFERTVNYSFLYDDYLFWAFDDVNNKFKLSSLKFEDLHEDKHLFMLAENASSSLDSVRQKIENPNLIIWSYANDKRENKLGSDRDKLFPNVAFSGVTNGTLDNAGCKGPCFDSVLKAMGDTSKESIQKQTDMSGKSKTTGNADVFGKLKVIRNYPNNTHKMYSLAKTIREYKLATYGKVLYIHIKNTIGPVLGSKAAIVCYASDRKIRTSSLDTVYTDNYILVEKIVFRTTEMPTTYGTVVTKNSDEVTTVLKFISNRLGSEGFEDVEKLLDKLKDYKGK